MAKSSGAMKRSSAMSAGGGGQGGKIVEGGGFSFTADSRTYTFQQKNGVAYNVSDLAMIPIKFGSGIDSNELVKRMRSKGTDVQILTPEQMQARRDARNAEREAQKNIDYELGGGVPWGNKTNRQAARRGRMMTRANKRR